MCMLLAAAVLAHLSSVELQCRYFALAVMSALQNLSDDLEEPQASTRQTVSRTHT